VRWLSDAALAHLCRLPEGTAAAARYELIEEIGQGGMGTVYRARDRQLDRPVALKVLRAAVAGAELQARMVQEAHIIARLEHPGIVPVHDCGTLPDGRFFYAMKLIRGQRLDAEKVRAMPLPERVQLLQKVCDAVAYAHAQGVLHRDLKPENIMVGAFGEVLVMDWGVARVAAEASPESPGPASNGCLQSVCTKHGTVVGTPGYMAPEQARGDVGRIDVRADVYSLGAVLYFLLTGGAPRHEPTEAGAPALVPPRRLDASIPRPIEAVCVKALASDPGERYADMSSLAADLADFVAGRRVAAYAESVLETALRLATKYRTVLALIVAYVVMRILLLLFADV
jgi:serine/threonine protein kinase